MKNIHVLPTDKPSRLHFNEFEELVFTPKYEKLDGVNICITNSEEIKIGDYYLSLGVAFKCTALPLSDTLAEKIILTTDTRLAPDVQKISDEFLEFIVKNPSCEGVEVKEFEPIYGHQNNSSSILYKIIIPKEEPKQETLEEAAENHAKIFQFPFDCDPAETFINGARWQQERSYSEEEVMEMFHKLSMHLPLHYEMLVREMFKNK